MGLWDNLKDSISSANEEAHASRLKHDAEATIRLTDGLSPELKADVCRGFLARREELLRQYPNWSDEGRLHIAREILALARKERDLNVSGSLANALAAIWLESGSRRHPVSAMVHTSLDRLAGQWQALLQDEAIPPTPHADSANADQQLGSAPTVRDANEVLKLADLLLAACLCIKFMETRPSVVAFSEELSALDSGERETICAAGYGIVDGLLDLRGIGKEWIVESFFCDSLGMGDAESKFKTRQLAKLRFGDPLFFIIAKARQAVEEYASNNDMVVFARLGDILQRDANHVMDLHQISTPINYQLRTGHATLSSIDEDEFSLGYVFGFHDAMCQRWNTAANTTEGFALLTVSYSILAESEVVGARILRKSLDLQRSEQFLKGMVAGGNDALASRDGQHEPLGLVRHLKSRRAAETPEERIKRMTRPL